MEGSLSVGSVCSLLFGDPYPQVDVDAKDEGLVPKVGVNYVECLPDEVGREGGPRMVDFVRSVVESRC